MELDVHTMIDRMETKLRGRTVVVNEEAVAAANHLVALIRSEGIIIPKNLQCKLTFSTVGAMSVSLDLFMDAVQCSFNKLYNINEYKFVEQLQQLPNSIVIQCEQKQALLNLSTRLHQLLTKHTVKTVAHCLNTIMCQPRLQQVLHTYGLQLKKAFEQADTTIAAKLPQLVNDFLRLYYRRGIALKPPACARGVKRARMDETTCFDGKEDVKQLNRNVQKAVINTVQNVLQEVAPEFTPLCIQRCVEKTENVLLNVQQLMSQQIKKVHNRVTVRMVVTCEKVVTRFIKP